MRLFARTPTDPHRWTALWRMLEPYGGRVTPDSIAFAAAHPAQVSSRERRRAFRQLLASSRMLDTEAHARYLSGTPWQGPDRPFARARFLRAVDAVVVAGPDAVARVAADPSLIGDYDDRTVLERSDLRRREPSLVYQLASSGGSGDFARVPSRVLRQVMAMPDWYRPTTDHDPFDPEELFVFADLSFGDESRRTELDDASDRVQRALGGHAGRRPELSTVIVYVAGPLDGEDVDPESRGDSAHRDEELVEVVIDADPAAYPSPGAFVTDVAARTAVQLLACPAPWTDAQRAGLAALAGGPAA